MITGIEPAARPAGLYLEIGIENQGTAMITGEGTVEIATQGFIEDFAVDTFVPGTSIGYPIKWTDIPREGIYEATVEIDYDGRVAQWSGSFTVGDPVLADLEDSGVDVPGGFPVVPIAIAGVVLAAGATGWWTIRRRRAARRRSPWAERSNPALSMRTGTSIPVERAGGLLPSVDRRYPISGPPPPPPISSVRVELMGWSRRSGRPLPEDASWVGGNSFAPGEPSSRSGGGPSQAPVGSPEIAFTTRRWGKTLKWGEVNEPTQVGFVFGPMPLDYRHASELPSGPGSPAPGPPRKQGLA